MLADCREIIREVSIVSNLEEALAILVGRVKDSLPVDAFAIYLTGAEAGQYVLKASDAPRPEAKGQVWSGAQAGLLGPVGERRELVILNNAPAHPRYAPAAETGEQPFDTFLGVPLIHYHQVLGVLVAWKQVRGQFDKDEVSFFVTIGAQLGKVVYDASNVDVVVELGHNEAGENAYIQGVQAATGVAIGTATLIDPLANLESVPDRHAEDIDAQEVAFRAAVLAVQAELGASTERLADVLPSEVRELFDAYIMLLGSDSLLADTLARIRAGNWAARAAACQCGFREPANTVSHGRQSQRVRGGVGAVLVRAHRELMEEGQAAAKPKVGVMIEVPSAVFLTKALAARVEFLSVGTNDLTQYILAADRTNARVTTANDTLHPAVLNAISMIIRDAHTQSTPVSVCGEMAGDPAGALVLLGMGVDALCMSPASFDRVKLVIRTFTLKRARALADQGLGQEDERQVRGLLNDALEGAGILKHRPVSKIARAQLPAHLQGDASPDDI